MSTSFPIRGAPPTDQAGVSLIEAIVGLVISSILITSMGGMLMNMQTAYKRADSSFAASRNDVFTDRQLRALMMRVVNQPGKNINKKRFEGGRSEISGVVTGGLMGHELATPFEIKVLDEDEDGAVLALELDETKYKLHMQNLISPHFSFLDERGRVHDTWPPSNQNTSLIRGATARFSRSELPTAVIVESDSGDTGIMGRALVLRLAGPRVYTGSRK